MIRRVIRGLRSQGLQFLSIRASSFFQRTIGYRRLIVLAYEGAPNIRDQGVVELTRESARSIDNLPWDIPTLDRRFDERSRLHAIREEGVFTSFVWTVENRKGWVAEIDRAIELPSEGTWIFDAVTPSEYRGRGYYPRLMAAVCSSTGDKPPFLYVRTTNTASRRGLTKSCFANRGTIIQLLGRVASFPHRRGPQFRVLPASFSAGDHTTIARGH
jgi:hypothetical protein